MRVGFGDKYLFQWIRDFLDLNEGSIRNSPAIEQRDDEDERGDVERNKGGPWGVSHKCTSAQE